MSKTLKWIIFSLIGLIIILFLLKLSGIIGTSDTIKVTTEKVSKRTIIETVNASGKIFPAQEVKISSDIPGEITELNVTDGQTVKKGQVLARIKSQIMSSSLTSPIDGVVTVLNVKKGERVTGNTMMAGTELMRISDLKNMEVRVDVGENDITKVQVNDSAIIEVEAFNNKKFKGIVKQVANSNNSGPRDPMSGAMNDITSYKVYISISTDSSDTDAGKAQSFHFRPGMTATADIQTQKHENRLSVPINSVTTRNRDSTLSDSKSGTETKNADELDVVVFVLQKDGTVKKVKVMTDIQDINYIEITGGLQDGDEVVTAPYSAINSILKDGAKVKVVPKSDLLRK